jgi:hypothetical protein
MHVSEETPSQTNARLGRVLAAARLDWREGAYEFREYPAADFPAHEAAGALAFVRDDETWSVLREARPGAAETFALFSFHFPEGLGNSGFVGWLASRLKAELGTGVFVVCGQNSRRGGIFDHWGVPLAMRDAAAKLLEGLRSREA